MGFNGKLNRSLNDSKNWSEDNIINQRHLRGGGVDLLFSLSLIVECYSCFITGSEAFTVLSSYAYK